MCGGNAKEPSPPGAKRAEMWLDEQVGTTVLFNLVPLDSLLCSQSWHATWPRSSPSPRSRSGTRFTEFQSSSDEGPGPEAQALAAKFSRADLSAGSWGIAGSGCLSLDLWGDSP